MTALTLEDFTRTWEDFAMPVRTELATRRRSASRAWKAQVGSGDRPAQGVEVAVSAPAIGPDVLASWARSAEWVDPDCPAAPVDNPEAVLQAWTESRAARGVRAAQDEVRQVVEDGELIAAVTDSVGRIVWTAGSRVMRRAAERVNFVPGGRWDEASVGTNALALALRNACPSTVYSAEHFSRAVHGWVCYAVPLSDPATGEVLGVLDLSTTWDRAHPLVMAAARALGRAVTAGLGTPPVPPLAVRILGEPRACLAGGEVPLSPRQAEILALLALHPEGLTLQRLHDRLYGDLPVTSSTLKAEVSHLRTLLGGALGSRPYRLTTAVTTDVHRLLAALDRGDLAGAVAAYGGPLLPLSESPGVQEWRDYVDVALRNAVLASSQASSVLAFADRHPYDGQVQQHLVDVLPAADPRRPHALARVDRASSALAAG